MFILPTNRCELGGNTRVRKRWVGGEWRGCWLGELDPLAKEEALLCGNIERGRSEGKRRNGHFSKFELRFTVFSVLSIMSTISQVLWSCPRPVSKKLLHHVIDGCQFLIICKFPFPKPLFLLSFVHYIYGPSSVTLELAC